MDPRHRFVVLSLPDGRVLCLASVRDVRVLRMSHGSPNGFHIHSVRGMVSADDLRPIRGAPIGYILSRLIPLLEHQNGINSSQPSLQASWLSTYVKLFLM